MITIIGTTNELMFRAKSHCTRLHPCRVGHNEVIGVMRVGCNAEGLGRDHWNEMLAYPRKPIAHWHPLLESKKSEKEVSEGRKKFSWITCTEQNEIKFNMTRLLITSGLLSML